MSIRQIKRYGNIKKIIKNNLIVIVLSLIILRISLLWYQYTYQNNNYEFIDNTLNLLSIILNAVGVLFIAIQLYDTKKIQEAEFIVELNQAFVSNPNYAKMYSKLEKNDQTKEKIKLDMIEISNYLTFFETIYILLVDGVITLSILDDLFSYRFFLAIHNETVQKMKLVNSPSNFRNIFLLEKIWMKYRQDNGLKIYKEELSLEKACEKAHKLNEYKTIIGE